MYRPHRFGHGHRVVFADECQYGTIDIGERDQTITDGDAAFEHAVVHEEIVDEVLEGRSRPGDPAVVLDESALPFAG